MTNIKAGNCVIYQLRPSIPTFYSGIVLSEQYDGINGQELQIRTTDKRLSREFLVHEGSNIMKVPHQLLTGELSVDEFLIKERNGLSHLLAILPDQMKSQIESLRSNYRPISGEELKILLMYLGFSE